jgi:hypothetical protein
MKACWYPARNKWRVQIPAHETTSGKRSARFFAMKEPADDWIRDHGRTGELALTDLLEDERRAFGLIRRLPGEVAQAMGDTEATVKRFYTEALEPNSGRIWFDLPAVVGKVKSQQKKTALWAVALGDVRSSWKSSGTVSSVERRRR